jgi:hypothetical protein
MVKTGAVFDVIGAILCVVGVAVMAKVVGLAESTGQVSGAACSAKPLVQPGTVARRPRRPRDPSILDTWPVF